jgi:putative NADH-flavin reductase
MRIAVLGGTGMIGSRIVVEAAGRHHTVSCISRSGGGPQLPGVTLVEADATDPEFVAGLGESHDVIVATTVPSREPGADHSPYLTTISLLVEHAGDALLFVVGGYGSLLMPDGTLNNDRPGAPAAYREEATTVVRGFQYLTAHARDLRWTYLCPPILIEPGERTGEYQLGTDRAVGPAISSEDFAVAVLDEVERPAHVGRRFTVAAR